MDQQLKSLLASFVDEPSLRARGTDALAAAFLSGILKPTFLLCQTGGELHQSPVAPDLATKAPVGSVALEDQQFKLFCDVSTSLGGHSLLWSWRQHSGRLALCSISALGAGTMISPKLTVAAKWFWITHFPPSFGTQTPVSR